MSFSMRGLDGRVDGGNETKDDPRRWGYPLLEGSLDFPSEKARGFPVVSAKVIYPDEGYGAYMGWVQVVQWREEGSEQDDVVVDKPPAASRRRLALLLLGPQTLLLRRPLHHRPPAAMGGPCLPHGEP